eukprot:SAG22_NODE_1719_length_3739_cov_4.655769_3_plen_563_part_00
MSATRRSMVVPDRSPAEDATAGGRAGGAATAKQPRHKGAAVRIDLEEAAAAHANAGHFAGRGALGGAASSTVHAVDGMHLTRHTAEQRSRGSAPPQGRVDQTMVIGGACSQCLSGKNLERVLRSGFEMEAQAMADLAKGAPATPLAVHTSMGTPPALGGFLRSLEQHLPWRRAGDHSEDRDGDGADELTAAAGRDDDDDWVVSLQVEGASAVWAACDLLLQLQAVRGRGRGGEAGRRQMVATGAYSYHGPQSTSLGSATPIDALKPSRAQVHFPVPAVFARFAEEPDAEFHARLLGEYERFLAEHGASVGVLLVEPQWGSSAAAQPWPPALLRAYIAKAQARGILVCCDEIMCGLGRHGQGPALFLSAPAAWDLRPDAVTFGKAIGGGVYPLSGCILRRGKAELAAADKGVLQMHTYSGSSTRALMAGQAVLDTLPAWFGHVAECGAVCAGIFAAVERVSRGTLKCHGQGLMWGALFTYHEPKRRARAATVFERHCRSPAKGGSILPYFVVAGGFMVTPPLDTSKAELDEVGRRLLKVVNATTLELLKDDDEWSMLAPRAML